MKIFPPLGRLITHSTKTVQEALSQVSQAPCSLSNPFHPVLQGRVGFPSLTSSLSENKSSQGRRPVHKGTQRTHLYPHFSFVFTPQFFLLEKLLKKCQPRDGLTFATFWPCNSGLILCQGQWRLTQVMVQAELPWPRGTPTALSQIRRAVQVLVQLQFAHTKKKIWQLFLIFVLPKKEKKMLLLQLQELSCKKFLMQMIWQTVGEWGMFRFALHQNEFTTFGNKTRIAPCTFSKKAVNTNSEVEGRKSYVLAEGLAVR